MEAWILKAIYQKKTRSKTVAPFTLYGQMVECTLTRSIMKLSIGGHSLVPVQGLQLADLQQKLQ